MFEVLFEGLHKISKDNYQSTDPRNKFCDLTNVSSNILAQVLMKLNLKAEENKIYFI